MRYFLRIAYNGTRFHGWQIQQNAHSVQEAIEEALKILLKSSTPIMGCGRTDTGVHAQDFFLHFDGEINPQQDFIYSLNALLSDDIAVLELIPVKADAHARFDATSRTYEYRIHQKPNPFLQETSVLFTEDFDLDAMNKAAIFLLGEHDFSCFSKSNTQTKTNLCHVSEAHWKQKENELIFTISANRFLRNMVRAITGTLLEVGRSKMEIENVKKIIASKNRSKAGASVPAKGLFLTNIKYPFID